MRRTKPLREEDLALVPQPNADGDRKRDHLDDVPHQTKRFRTRNGALPTETRRARRCALTSGAFHYITGRFHNSQVRRLKGGVRLLRSRICFFFLFVLFSFFDYF